MVLDLVTQIWVVDSSRPAARTDHLPRKVERSVWKRSVGLQRRSPDSAGASSCWGTSSIRCPRSPTRQCAPSRPFADCVTSGDGSDVRWRPILGTRPESGRQEQSTPAATAKAATGVGRAVLVGVFGRAMWALPVSVFSGGVQHVRARQLPLLGPARTRRCRVAMSTPSTAISTEGLPRFRARVLVRWGGSGRGGRLPRRGSCRPVRRRRVRGSRPGRAGGRRDG